METEEVEFNSFSENDFTCVENSSKGYIPTTLMSQTINVEESIEPQGIVGDDNRVKVTNTSVGTWCNTVKLLLS